MPSDPLDEQHRSAFHGRPTYVHEGSFGILAETKQIFESFDTTKDRQEGRMVDVCLPVPSQVTNVPLVCADEVVGILVLDTIAPSPQAKEALWALAGLASTALERARARENAQQRIRDLEIVNRVVGDINTKLKIEEVATAVVTQVADKLRCTHCTLFLPQREEGKFLLSPLVSHGPDSKRALSRRFKMDEGLAGLVFQTGKSLALDDARQHPDFSPARVQKDAPRSMLVVPVKVGDQTVGIISADQDAFGWFSESDRRLVDALAQQTGIAIERARALSLLEGISEQIIGAQKVGDILQHIVSGAIQLTNTTSGVIYLISRDGGSVLSKYEYPPEFEHPEPRLEHEGSLTRCIIENGQMLIYTDIQGDTGDPGKPRVNPVLYDRVHSMIAVPLKLGERVVGVLYLNDEHKHRFTDTEKTLLQMLANQAASVLHSMEQRVQDVSAFAEVSGTILLQDLDKTSDLIVQKTAELTGANYCVLRLVDDSRSCLIARAYSSPERIREDLPIDGKSFTASVARASKGRICANVKEDPDYLEWYPDVESCMAAPLKRGDALIGTLYVESTQRNAFSEESQLALLQAFADQAAIAIENARLLRELETRARQLESLQQVATKISGELSDLDEILCLVVENVSSIFRASACAIRLYHGQAGGFGRKVATGTLKDSWLHPRPDGTSRHVIETKKPFYVDDTSTALPAGQPIVREEMVEQGVRAIAYLPLLSHDSVIGILYVNLDTPHPFSTAEKRTLELFASQAAVAIENAQLYEGERKRATQLTMVSKVAQQAAVILNPDQLFREVAATIQASFNYYTVSLFILDETADNLKLVAIDGGFRAQAWPDWPDYRQAVGVGLVGWSVQTGELLLVNNVTEDDRFVSGFLPEGLTRSELG